VGVRGGPGYSDERPHRLVDVDEPQVRSFEEAKIHIWSLTSRCTDLERRVRTLEVTRATGVSPWWKRVLFRIDGWGPWWIERDVPRWRPWRRFWTA
jgi:hypothetical protein